MSTASNKVVGIMKGPKPFRLLGASMFFNALGMVAEQVVLGWLVLQVSNSPMFVGTAYAMRMAPLFLGGIPAGVLADRWDRIRLLRAANALMAAAMATICALIVLDLVELWHVLVLTALGGCGRAIVESTRQGQIHDLVGPGQLVSGVALVGLALRLGGIVGAVGAGGIVAGWGSGAGYGLIASAYLASAAVLVGVSGVRAAGPTTTRASLRDFLALVRRDKTVPLLMVLTAGTEMLGFSCQTVLPSLARDVLRVGALGLGAMTGARYVGGFSAVLAVSRFGTPGRMGHMFLAVVAIFGMGLVALGLASELLWVLIVLAVVDAMAALSDTLSQSLVQLAVPAALRGRAGGAWTLAVGTSPLGQLQIGALASLFGVSTALMLNGIGLIVLAGIGALTFAPVKRLGHTR